MKRRLEGTLLFIDSLRKESQDVKCSYASLHFFPELYDCNFEKHCDKKTYFGSGAYCGKELYRRYEGLR